MNTVRAIVWKETRSFLREKLRLGALILFALFFGTYFTARFGQLLLVPTALMMMVASIYVLCHVSYAGEVQNKTLPSLLASPVTLRRLFLGKGLAVFIFSYAIELIGVTVCVGFSWFQLGELPSLASAFTALVVVPIWGFTFIELFGMLYNLVRGGVVIWLLAFPLYVALMSTAVSTRIGIIFSSVWLPPVAGLGMAALLYAVAGKISKDRMTRLAS